MRMTAQERLAEMQKILTRATQMWQEAGDSSLALYKAVETAEAAFSPAGGPAYRISLWYADPDVGELLRDVAQQLKDFRKHYEDWIWQHASLAERREINEGERQYRLEAR